MKRNIALGITLLTLGLTLPATAVSPTPAGLSAAQAADLQFMREEEKLARDVYGALATKWASQVFANIRQSEQQHTDRLAALLAARGLADPGAALGPGQFADASLAALYAQLVAQGKSSRVEALKVGAAIEEIDIRDLDQRIASMPDAEVRLAYESLRDASWRHLASFVRNLEREGVRYTPQTLEPSLYADQLRRVR